MSIRVVDVRGINSAEGRAGEVYVGRAFAGWPQHPLCNPSSKRNGMSLEDNLKLYQDRLSRSSTLEGDLMALWIQTRQGELPLGCWCCNAEEGDGSAIRCHGQILCKMLHDRFVAPRKVT